MNAFWNDDLQQRGLILFVTIMLVVYGNNALSVEQNLSEGSGRVVTIAAYLVASAGIGFVFISYSFFIKAWRVQIRALGSILFLAISFWIGAIFANAKQAAALAAVALM